jgi:TPR repeat protein
MYNLGKYYEKIEDYENMKKYYLMAIKLENTDAIHALKKKVTPLELYLLFKKENIEYTDPLTKEIQIYLNKLLLSKIDECGICLETNNCILLNCFRHYICTSCYIKFYDKPCPYCKM